MMCRRLLALPLTLWLGACGSAPPDGSETAQGSGRAAAPQSTPDRAEAVGPRRAPCPMLPCRDGVVVTATFDAAHAPLGEHTFDVSFGARTVTCTVDVRQAADLTSGRCAGDAELSFGPVTRTVEDTTSVPGAVSVSFVPVPGRFQFRLELAGVEPDVHVVHRARGRVLLDQRASLTYAEDRPNGAGCDPVCQRAEVAWDLPGAP